MDTWKAEAEACFAPEDDVTVSCDRAALRDVYGVKGSIVQVQGQSLVLIEDEEKEKLS